MVQILNMQINCLKNFGLMQCTFIGKGISKYNKRDKI
mgnify:CR=1 FL=1